MNEPNVRVAVGSNPALFPKRNATGLVSLNPLSSRKLMVGFRPFLLTPFCAFVYWLFVRTPNAGVVSSNPERV